MARHVGENLRREARIVGLLFASTTSMIGSGWLFGAYHASRIAGPLSVWSWAVGAVIIMMIALCFAELAALFPRSGALVHMSHASHGEGLGRIWGWMLFLAYVPVPPIEAEAIVTYANNYLPYFIQPDLPRPFRLWKGEIVAPVAFICSNWIIYWTGFKTNTFLFALVGGGFILYAVYYHFIARKPAEDFEWRHIAWLLPWFGGMWGLSALGDLDGGAGVLGFWPAVALVGLWSVVVIKLALGSALPAADTAELMERLESTP